MSTAAVAPQEPPAVSGFGECPLPGRYDHVVLGHGGGGALTAELLQQVFLPAFGNDTLNALEDQATLAVGAGRIAVTTDSFVVRPLFFPGGDIGKLAVCGTVNDLAVGGAIPQFLTAAFVLEEGLPFAELARIVASMRRACDEAGVRIVAGDTKVVDRGKGDGVFITTTGVGVMPAGVNLSISAARPGDALLVSGTIGDHGVAVLSARENLDFETPLLSDCAPLGGLAQALLSGVPAGAVRCMRDPTRGGVTAVLNELAQASRVAVVLDEQALPFKTAVRGACEILGLDPLSIACEGRLVAAVAPEHAAAALAALRAHPLGRDAARIGTVKAGPAGRVTVNTLVGSERLLPLLSGELLPRIC